MSFYIGHRMLGDVLGFCAAAHLYSCKIGQPVKVWFDPTRKYATKYFDGVIWADRTELSNPVDCGPDPTLEEWPSMNGVKRFYRFMDPTMESPKSFDVHFNRLRNAPKEKMIGLITHSNTQGDIDGITLSEMLKEARLLFPEHRIVCFGNKDNVTIPEGVEDLRRFDGDICWIIEFVASLDLLITPQSGPAFIAAGWGVPMWVYKSKEDFWDYTLNYEKYKVERWWARRPAAQPPVFDEIYRNGGWNGQGSGPGSTIEFNKEYIWLLHKIINYTVSINSILDIGCGDWQIMSQIDLSGKQYLGIDVVASVIRNLQNKFSRENISFKTIDAVNDDFPCADLIIIKDVLQHLPNAAVNLTLSNISQRCRWAMITNDYTPENVAYDIKIGEWRPINVLLAPFSFPGITIAGYNGKHVTISGFPV